MSGKQAFERDGGGVHGGGHDFGALFSGVPVVKQEPQTSNGHGGTRCPTSNRKISTQDIQLVQNLIERCLQLYMPQGDVISALQEQARIEPGFTGLVWQKLEEQNPEFFRAYYTRLKVKDQITMFNHLLDQQVQMVQKLHRTWMQALPSIMASRPNMAMPPMLHLPPGMQLPNGQPLPGPLPPVAFMPGGLPVNPYAVPPQMIQPHMLAGMNGANALAMSMFSSPHMPGAPQQPPGQAPTGPDSSTPVALQAPASMPLALITSLGMLPNFNMLSVSTMEVLSRSMPEASSNPLGLEPLENISLMDTPPGQDFFGALVSMAMKNTESSPALQTSMAELEGSLPMMSKSFSFSDLANMGAMGSECGMLEMPGLDAAVLDLGGLPRTFSLSDMTPLDFENLDTS